MKITSTSLRFLCNMAQTHIEEAKSMTERYNPTDNATAERINGILKQPFLGRDTAAWSSP